MIDLKKDDILFYNVAVIDGSGDPRYLANVVVRGDSIWKITEPDASEDILGEAKDLAVRVIDGDSGRYCLTPGFVDMHAHSDLSLLHTPDHLAKISQGVTTEVIGQDGIGYAPVDDSAMERIRRQIAGWNGNPQDPPDFFHRWRSVEEYLDVLDDSRIATNAAYLLPQGNLRILTVGYENRPATEDELAKMRQILVQAMQDGAVGMSSGLTYVPGMFADNGELAQLCREVAKYDGFYSPHHRSYGHGALEAYAEMIDLAKRTGVRLHLAHATLNFPENAGKAQELVDMIDKALDEGVRITLDTYPYKPSSTTLASTLPSWVSSADNRRELLGDPKQLETIKRQCLVEGTDGCQGCVVEFDRIEIGGVLRPDLVQKCVGKRLAQIAEEQGEDPWQTYISILLDDDFNSTIIHHVGHEDNMRLIMRHRVHTGGSDGILTSTKPHPRAWGTFPRYIGHYARDLPAGKSRKIDSGDGIEFETVPSETVFAGGLEEVINHLTYRAASVIKVKDRGLVKEGWKADLVLFDKDTIRDKATFANPKQPADGIRSVLVNGIFAIDETKPTGARAGKTIRRRKGGSAAASFIQ